MGRCVRVLAGVWVALLVASGHLRAISSQTAVPQSNPRPTASEQDIVNRYCATCHNARMRTANLDFAQLDLNDVVRDAETWERVIRKVRGGLMPPPARPRPDAATLDGFAARLERTLDDATAARPNPGRTASFHRLNRAEYRNAIRDVLALDIDVADLLPADTASFGFDNVAGGLRISESLMEAYLSAARRISRAAVGMPPAAPLAETYKVSPALPQDSQIEGLPFGTRGGTLLTHLFPVSAEYTFRLDLAGSGGGEAEIFLDDEVVHRFTLERGGRVTDVDGNEIPARLEVQLPVTGGSHRVGVAFVKTPSVLAEGNRRPFLNPTVSRPPITVLRSVTIAGPFNAVGAGASSSRAAIFTCEPSRNGVPASEASERTCANSILSRLARRAYRRPVTQEDAGILLSAYDEGRRQGTFDSGIERGLRQLLVSPHFLFRVEVDHQAGGAYRVSDLELASRLSFFLWSSIPDDELLDRAVAGTLSQPAILEQQVRRMLTDPRAVALTDNFVGQWLHLRNLASVKPSEVLFPDFDDGLREGFRRETELLFQSLLAENRSVLDLLTADYTFANERLAEHYGIPNIQGSHFRKVTLPDPNRRGLLGQGSILLITSHPVRTSPVFRGKWILETLLGTPPPPPPPNVPALPDPSGVYARRAASMRERMSEHRDNPACSSCHSMIDPLGFGMENFDAVGRWREVDESYRPIDASGALPDGTTFNGVAELSSALIAKPDRFVTTLTEKMLTYALGRGVEYYDMPAVRRIVKESSADGYRLSAIILGITRSLPFQMRRPDAATVAAQ